MDKLLRSYMLFISTMDKKWLDYISTNRYDTIHYIIQYLKTDLLKILHTRLNTNNMAHSNKRQ